MKTITLTALCVVSLGALAGCKSSTTTPPPPPTYATLSAEAAAMQSQYTDGNGALNVGVTPATTVEIQNSANGTYTGYISGENLANEGLVGTLTVDADFGAETTTDTATGFIHETDGDLAGTLTGTGTIQPTAPAGSPQYTTTLNGTLGGDLTDLALDGYFVPNGGDPTGAIAGEVNGTVGTDLLSGEFAAEK